jgi:hypothetical protein
MGFSLVWMISSLFVVSSAFHLPDDGLLEVLEADRLVQVLPPHLSDLLGALALDHPSHGHHGGVPRTRSCCILSCSPPPPHPMPPSNPNPPLHSPREGYVLRWMAYREVGGFKGE